MSVLVIVRRNPCHDKEAYQVGLLPEGFDTELLKDPSFGLSTGEFFRLIGLTPESAEKFFPRCVVPSEKLSSKEKKSFDTWDEPKWRWLGLMLGHKEFQTLADLIKLPVVRYIYGPRTGHKVVGLVGRTDPQK